MKTNKYGWIETPLLAHPVSNYPSSVRFKRFLALCVVCVSILWFNAYFAYVDQVRMNLWEYERAEAQMTQNILRYIVN